MDEAERLGFIAYSRLGVFRRREKEALNIIEKSLKIGRSYVAVSWGKDSVALLHLAQRLDPDIEAVFLSTPHEDLIDNYSSVSESYRMRFSTCYRKIAVGEKTIPRELKEQALWLQYEVALIGLRAEENQAKRGRSIRRLGLLHQYKSGQYAGAWRALPLGYWTWEDVWAYTCKNDLPYLASYDHEANVDRKRSRTTNVMPHGRGITGSRANGRIARLKAISPEAFSFLADNRPDIAGDS